jgi:hypothetical protein
VITEEGVYDLPEHVYHGDPVAGGSLSSSIARKLIPPSCPALARHALDTPSEATEAMELGTIVHALTLGRGGGIVAVDAPDWRSGPARALRDQARADGKTPILAHKLATPRAMAAAVRAHPVASRLLTDGTAEQVIVWREQVGDDPVWCRAMLDWHPNPGRAWPLVIGDLKTAADASPAAFRRAVREHRYDVQEAFYRRGYARVHGVHPADVAFVFIVVQSTPPHLVQCYQLDGWTGDQDTDTALTTWADCTRTDTWPAWDGADDITTLTPGRWS